MTYSEVNVESDDRAVCSDCYSRMREQMMTRDEQLKADAERVETKRLEAIAKRREQRKQEKELYVGRLMSNE